MAEPTSSASVVNHQSTENEHLPPLFPIERVRYIGAFLIGVSVVLALLAWTAGTIYTSPPAGVSCFPPEGGPAIACPPLPLTLNNLFVLITLIITSVGALILGVMILLAAWLRQGPPAEHSSP